MNKQLSNNNNKKMIMLKIINTKMIMKMKIHNLKNQKKKF